MEYLIIISKTLFGLLGLCITYLVYELNRQKFRLDLLDKRNDAYADFKKVLEVYLKYSGIPLKHEEEDPSRIAYYHANQFSIKTNLFGADVKSLSKDLSMFVRTAVKYEIDRNRIENSKITSDDGTLARIHDEIDDLFNQYKNLNERAIKGLKPYLIIKEPLSIGDLFRQPFCKIIDYKNQNDINSK